MKRILIPIDGSVYSDKAVEAGRELAKAFDSDIILLNVVQVNFPMITAGPVGMEPTEINRLYEEASQASALLLEEAKKKLEGAAGTVETVKLHGDVKDNIIEYINNNPIDLVIMGSYGMGAVLNRLFTGSVTTKVLHHVDKPVLVIK